MKGARYNFARKANVIARELVGRTLETKDYVAKILETEAYEGGEQTSKRTCMLLAPGQIGIMPFRGLSFLNIGTEKAGIPSCVLIRSVDVDGEIYDGPGKVGKILKAYTLNYKVIGQDIGLGGRTQSSTHNQSCDRSSNSFGRYRLTP